MTESNPDESSDQENCCSEPPRQPGRNDTRSALSCDVLRELVGDDPDLITELLTEYRTSLFEIVPEMVRALDDGELGTAAALGHKLKSSSRAVGALPLGDLCESIEEADRVGCADPMPDFQAWLLASVAAVYERLRILGIDSNGEED